MLSSVVKEIEMIEKKKSRTTPVMDDTTLGEH